MTRDEIDALTAEIRRRGLLINAIAFRHGAVAAVVLRCGISVEAVGDDVAGAVFAAVRFYDELLARRFSAAREPSCPGCGERSPDGLRCGHCS